MSNDGGCFILLGMAVIAIAAYVLFGLWGLAIFAGIILILIGCARSY